MGEVGADWMPWFDVLFRSFGKTFGGTFTFLPIAARFHTSFSLADTTFHFPLSTVGWIYNSPDAHNQ